MATHPHHERGSAGEETGVFAQGGLFGGVDGDEEVGEAEADGVAFEEVGEVDEVVSGFGVARKARGSANVVASGELTDG